MFHVTDEEKANHSSPAYGPLMHSCLSFLLQWHLSAKPKQSQNIWEQLHPEICCTSRSSLMCHSAYASLWHHRRANPLVFQIKRWCSLRTAPSCPVSSSGLAPTHTHYSFPRFAEPSVRHAKLIPKPLYKPLTLCSFHSHNIQASIDQASSLLIL